MNSVENMRVDTRAQRLHVILPFSGVGVFTFIKKSLYALIVTKNETTTKYRQQLLHVLKREYLSV